MFTPKRSGNEALDRVQDDVARAFKDLAFVPTSPILADVALTTAGKDVAHGLGRIPRGFLVVRKNANADVWETAKPDDKFLHLDASATVTVSLLVF